MFPSLLSIGPFTLHTYGLMVALGFLAAVYVARKQFVRFLLPADLLDRLVVYLMLFGILGSRILYFAVDNFMDLKVDPLSFLRIWEGGLVFYGGVIADLLVLFIFSRIHHLPFFRLTDAFAAPLLLAHSLGRLGCFAAGCCYGKSTALPWGVVFTDPACLAPRFVPLHPTQIYEALGNLVLFLIVMGLSRRPLRIGTLTAFYAVAYGAFRFGIEILRGDERGYFHFGASPSQLVAVGLMAIGLGVLVYAKKNEVI